MELVRLLQRHRLTYLTKLTPRRDDFILYLGRKVMHQRGHLLLDDVQLGISIDGYEALAHHRQIDVLIMRMGDHERSVNTKVKRAPRHITCPVRNRGGVNRKGACLLLRDQLELIVDQLDGNAQVVMFVALLLEGVLHLAELLRPQLFTPSAPSLSSRPAQVTY